MDDRERMRSIDASLERIGQLQGTRRNQMRQNASGPQLTVGMEEPIVWTHLFGFDCRDYFADPLFYVDQTLKQRLWRFCNIDDDVPLSADLSVWLGHYPEATFIGLDVATDAVGVPTVTCHPLVEDPDFTRLPAVDFNTSGWMPKLLWFYDEMRRIADGRFAVTFPIWWRGPLDLAVELRGYENLMADAAEDPDYVHGLLGWITDQRIAWTQAYCAHFGAPLAPASIGDDWINIPFISPDFFTTFVLPCYLRLEALHGGIQSIHSCGNQGPVQHAMQRIRSLRGYEVSAWTSLEETLANLPAEMRLHISLHPNDVLFPQGDATEQYLRKIAHLCAGRQYNIGTSGLTPILEAGTQQAFLARIGTYIHMAYDIFNKDHQPKEALS